MEQQVSHRREIQGLRALAVICVIVNHTFASLLPGGFLGVDIFFLISGYLITHQLLGLVTSEKPTTALLTFYSRRIKRILPSALLVIWVTIWMAFKYLGPVIGNDSLTDGRWASLFFANQRFNQIKVDYFAQGIPAPLLQHYWSLAVEEQFYLLWPILLILTYLIAKSKFRLTISLVTIAISILSFYSIFHIETTLRYFGTLPRVWELSLGALVAIANLPKIPDLFSWLGLIAIGISVLVLTEESQVPGFAILPALLGTAALLAHSPVMIRKILGNPVMHYLGDISFLLYLWHWPIIELHKQLAMQPLTNNSLLALIAITLILSILTHHFFENPIRFSAKLKRSPILTTSIGTGAIAASVIATLLLVKG